MTPDEAISAVESLSLPEVFLEVWRGQLPMAIYDVCQRPKRYFDILDELNDCLPQARNLVPLWETNRDSIVGYDKKNEEYLRYYYGTPAEECEHLGNTYQKFLTSFFVDLIDSGVWNELSDLSRLFGYNYIIGLKNLAENTSDEQWDEAYSEFLSQVD